VKPIDLRVRKLDESQVDVGGRAMFKASSLDRRLPTYGPSTWPERDKLI
jgi:hypothetical protein